MVVRGTGCDSLYTLLNVDGGVKPEMVATDNASYSTWPSACTRCLASASSHTSVAWPTGHSGLRPPLQMALRANTDGPLRGRGVLVAGGDGAGTARSRVHAQVPPTASAVHRSTHVHSTFGPLRYVVERSLRDHYGGQGA